MRKCVLMVALYLISILIEYKFEKSIHIIYKVYIKFIFHLTLFVLFTARRLYYRCFLLEYDVLIVYFILIFKYDLKFFF